MSIIERKMYKIPKKIQKNYSENTINHRVYRRLFELMRDSNKVTLLGKAEIEFNGPKKCDKQFVNVAIQSNATLVTADDTIKGPIKEGGNVISKCICKTAAEVLEEKSKNEE